MKYLSRYNIFESSDDKSRIKSYLSDILLELSDKEIYSHINQFEFPKKISILLSIYDFEPNNGLIYKPKSKPFEIDDIIDSLYHIDSYLQEELYKINYIAISAKSRSTGYKIADYIDTIEELKRYCDDEYYEIERLTLRYIPFKEWLKS